VSALDRAVKRILLARFGPLCWNCGKRATDVAHIISRSYQATRYDTHEHGNCHLLCRECHDNFHAFKGGASYATTFSNRYGEEAYMDLHNRAHAGLKSESNYIFREATSERLYREADSLGIRRIFW
jgi:hypothetical protein